MDKCLCKQIGRQGFFSLLEGLREKADATGLEWDPNYALKRPEQLCPALAAGPIESGFTAAFLESRLQQGRLIEQVRVCTIVKRMQRLQRLHLRYQKYWHQHKFPAHLNKKQADFCYVVALELKQKHLKQGFAITREHKIPAPKKIHSTRAPLVPETMPSSGWPGKTTFSRDYQKKIPLPEKEATPSLLWWFAYALEWGLGLRVHWINLRRSSIEDILPVYEPPHNIGVDCIILEEVWDLWEPEKNHYFESIIQWATHAGVPVWIDFLQNPEGVVTAVPQKKVWGTYNRQNSQIQKRLTELRQKHPLHWVGESTKSRLQEICRIPNQSS